MPQLMTFSPSLETSRVYPRTTVSKPEGGRVHEVNETKPSSPVNGLVPRLIKEQNRLQKITLILRDRLLEQEYAIRSILTGELHPCSSYESSIL